MRCSTGRACIVVIISVVGVALGDRPRQTLRDAPRSHGRRTARVSSLLDVVGAEVGKVDFGDSQSGLPSVDHAANNPSPKSVPGKVNSEVAKELKDIARRTEIQNTIDKNMIDEAGGATPAEDDLMVFTDAEDELKEKISFLPLWAQILIWIAASCAICNIIYTMHGKLAEPEVGVASILCCLYCWHIGGFLIFFFPIDETPIGDSIEVVECPEGDSTAKRDPWLAASGCSTPATTATADSFGGSVTGPMLDVAPTKTSAPALSPLPVHRNSGNPFAIPK